MANTFASLEQTIITDLKAGVSWLETEVVDSGLALWNILKAAFIALEPLEANILVDVLSAATLAAGTGASIEQVESTALNTAKNEQAAVLVKAGSGIIQTIIAGIRASTPSK